MDEAEEIVDVVLPACGDAAEVVHPGEEPLCPPASGLKILQAHQRTVIDKTNCISGSYKEFIAGRHLYLVPTVV